MQIPVLPSDRVVEDKPSNSFGHFVSGDLGEFREQMCSLFNHHNIISRERCAEAQGFEVGHVDLGRDLMISAVRYDQKVRIEAPPLDRFFVFQFTLGGSCHNTQGNDHADAAPGTLCVLNWDRPIRQDMSSGYRQMAVRVSRGLLENVLEEELGYSVRDPLGFCTEACPLQASTTTLVHALNNVWIDLQREQSGYSSNVVRGRINRTLAAMLLTAVPHNYSDLFACGGGGPVPFFVRQAELYMREKSSQKLTLADVASSTGVSMRTLQNGFRDFRGTTPMAYLKSVRLNAARQKLIRSQQNNCTVTEIALDCGFTHLSKFSQDYREQFGESPSETARRGTV